MRLLRRAFVCIKLCVGGTMARKREEWLVVDGYNVIGLQSHIHWNAKQLEEQRNILISQLSEYQAMTGRRVYVVFDAHQTPGARVQEMQEKVEVIFTCKDETADEFIEQFVRNSKNPHRRIYVATSDYLEQRMVFGQGAYRVSSRELLEQIRSAKTQLSENLRTQESVSPKNKLADLLPLDLRKEFEKLRRKK